MKAPLCILLCLLQVVIQVASQNDVHDSLIPRLIGIGCEKCGTTSLWKALKTLSWTSPCSLKESRAFLRKRVVPYEEYRRLWPAHMSEGNDRKNIIPYEITPKYLPNRQAAWRMKDTLPHANSVSLLAALREPKARAFSAFYQEEYKRIHSPQFISKEVHPKRVSFDDVVRLELEFLAQCYTQETFSVIRNRLDCRDALRLQPEKHRECKEQFLLNLYAQERIAQQTWHLTKMEAEYWLDLQLIQSGIYVDQLYNYLCAGFTPKRMIVVMTHQLLNMTYGLERISDHFELALDFKVEADKDEIEKGMVINRRTLSNVMSKSSEAKLAEFYAPYNERLQVLLESSFKISREMFDHEFSTKVPKV